MNEPRIHRAGVLALAVIGVLAAVWVLPPIAHQARHFCPVRPDGVSEAGAMPQWARRYGVSCSVCHTTVPALTQAGYKFRSAGFRMPDEIGNEAKFKDISDMYSARIREEFRIAGTKTDGTAANAKVGATNKFAFHELTFYPVSGAFGKWWSAESELTFAPDEFVEVENAYVRATVPYRDFVFRARAGIFHPFEGYGASDRPISNIQPLFKASTAKNGAFDTKVKIWGQDQEGAELGATYKDTNVSLAVLNGYNSGAGGANLGDDNNLRDFLFFANQMIGDKAAVSFEYLNGKTGFTYAGAGGSDWINNYQRGALYASYEALANNKLDVLGGYSLGKDHFMNAATFNGSDTFNSTGWYLEGRSKVHEHFTGGLRLDTFKPSTRTGSNRLSAVTFTGAIPFDNVKFLVDYQVKRSQKASPIKDVTENVLRLEWMMIF